MSDPSSRKAIITAALENLVYLVKTATPSEARQILGLKGLDKVKF